MLWGALQRLLRKSHESKGTQREPPSNAVEPEFNKDSINNYMDNKACCQEPFHGNCLLEYYCNNCKASICQKCTSTLHILHDKISIEEAAHLASERLKNEHARIDQVVEIRKKVLQLTRENKQRMQEQVQDEIAKVRNDFDAKIRILQEKQDATIAELNYKLEKKIKENDEKENMIAAALQEAEKLRDQCKVMTDMYLKHLILEGYEQLEELCKTTVKDEPNLSLPPVQTFVHYRANSDASQFLKKLELGEIEESVTDSSQCSIECVQSPTRCGFINQFLIVTRDSRGEECYTNKALIDVNIQDSDGNDVEKEITESKPGHFDVKFRLEKPSPYNVAVSIGRKTIQNSPQRIDVIDPKEEFKPVRFIKTTRASSPIALAMNGNGDIAVVNNIDEGNEYPIVLYSSDGEYVRDFGGDGTGEDRLEFPLGLAFINDNHILVSDYTGDGACIKEYHIDGRLLRTVYKQKGFTFTGMCTVDQDIACLSYNKQSEESSIMLFSSETGDHLQDIKLDAPNVKAVPRYLTYDNNKYFVSFYDVHSIYVFDENGGLLYTIGERGNKPGQFNQPGGLAVFGADMLLVCDRFNHRVQLFHQNGQYIRSFGTRGSGLGEMDGPFDIAVTPDGQVFVLELYHERIQVFK